MAPRRSARNSGKTPTSASLNKPESGETVKKTNRESVATFNQTKRVTKTRVAKLRVSNKKSNTMKGVAQAFINPNKKPKHGDAEPATTSATGGRQLKDHILELIDWAEGLEAKRT